MIVIIVGTLAALCTAVIFGTDVLGAVVMRPTYAEVDDRMLVQVTGRSHRYGNERMPVFGITSVIAAAATAVISLVLGHATSGVAAVIGLASLLIWLVLFNRISLPINKALIEASQADRVPANVRALQARWDSIINVRAVLQGIALIAFCVAIGFATR
ncbi:MAG TPA: DUF1772 domain-containing protein [Micromonosporaceae bacterium]|jgi:hypothetical protein